MSEKSIKEILDGIVYENRVKKLASITSQQLLNASTDEWCLLFREIGQVRKNKWGYYSPRGICDYLKLSSFIRPKYKMPLNAYNGAINRTKKVFKKLKESKEFINACFVFQNGIKQEKIKCIGVLALELLKASKDFFPYDGLNIKYKNDNGLNVAYTMMDYPQTIFINVNNDFLNKATVAEMVDNLFHEITHLCQYHRIKFPEKYQEIEGYDIGFEKVLEASQCVYNNLNTLSEQRQMLTPEQRAKEVSEQDIMKIYACSPSEQEAYLCGSAMQIVIDNLMICCGMQDIRHVPVADVLFQNGTDNVSQNDAIRVVDNMLSKFGERKHICPKNETGGYDHYSEPPFGEGSNPYHHMAWLKRVLLGNKNQTEKNIERHMLFAIKRSEFMADGPGPDIICLMKDYAEKYKNIDLYNALKGYQNSVNPNIAKNAKTAVNILRQTTFNNDNFKEDVSVRTCFSTTEHPSNKKSLLAQKPEVTFCISHTPSFAASQLIQKNTHNKIRK
ncbi:MAG: hypothetical protein IKV03_06460 [Alphaproteobacteria bacterium]|nr:hypothetical protein [Alphaproteobacteria bacterium]